MNIDRPAVNNGTTEIGVFFGAIFVAKTSIAFCTVTGSSFMFNMKAPLCDDDCYVLIEHAVLWSVPSVNLGLWIPSPNKRKSLHNWPEER